MDRSVQPLQVSPLIKAMRWTFLIFGIVYGVNKLERLKVYEASVKPKREQNITEKYRRLKEESVINVTDELYNVGRDFEVTEFPPGWNKDL